MSLCDTCRSPGSCCKGMVLNRSFDAGAWKSQARKLMKQHHLPLYPVRIFMGTNAPLGVDEPERVYVQFDCRKLGVDGRCTDYENRPELCRYYTAGIDALCAEHVQAFKGIPIRYEARA